MAVKQNPALQGRAGLRLSQRAGEEVQG